MGAGVKEDNYRMRRKGGLRKEREAKSGRRNEEERGLRRK